MENQMLQIPYISLPKKTIIKLTPDVYFCTEERYQIDIEKHQITKSLEKNIDPLKSSSNFLSKKKSFLALDNIEY